MRCVKPRPRTCPRCTSLTRAATRPRQDSGRFASFTEIRLARIQKALMIAHSLAHAARTKNKSAIVGLRTGRPRSTVAVRVSHDMDAARKKKLSIPSQKAEIVYEI